MSSFDFLSSEQTIFSNPDALDFEFVPKLLPHREEQQKYIAVAVKPLFQDRPGKNVIIRGSSGIGKTAATRRVLMDLDEVEEAENIASVYVNCWKANTTYKILTEVAHQLGFKFTHNLKTNEVMDKIREIAKKKTGAVIVLDEIDKADDYDFLYLLLENLSRLTLILITNDLRWGSEIDSRILSRLTPETIDFPQYTSAETADILRERIKYAFYEGVWAEEAFQVITEKASRYRDIRVGIALLKAAGDVAEADSSQKVKLEHSKKAIERTDEFKIKTSSELTDEAKLILSLCKSQSGKTTGALYSAYQSAGGTKSEKTFKRQLDRLANKKLIEMSLTGEGFSGRSSVIKYLGFEKRLTEF